MRKLFSMIFNFLGRTVVVLLAVLFVITAILVVLLTSIDHTLLQAPTYKRALAENGVYEQLPSLISEQLSLVNDFLADPCKANPLGCSIDGASPELQNCLTDVLGEDAYVEIGSGQRNPTEVELQSSAPCLERFKTASQRGPESGSPDQEQSSGKQTATGPQMTYLENLSAEQWQALILHLLPADELQEMTETTLDQLFAYLNGETDIAKMPLVKLKSHLSGQEGKDLLLLLVNAQPPCTEEQLAQINAGNFGGEGQPPIVCLASGEALHRQITELQRQLEEASSQIPDEAALVKPPSASDPSSGGGPLGKDPHTALLKINTLIRFSPLLPLALLLLVTLFGARSPEVRLRWFGIPLFVAGLIPLSLGIAAMPAFERAWVTYVVPKLPTVFSASSLIPLSHNVAHSVARDLSIWITFEAALVTLFGLGAIVGSYYVKRRSE